MTRFAVFGTTQDDSVVWFFGYFTVNFSLVNFFTVFSDDLIGYVSGTVDTLGVSFGFTFFQGVVIFVGRLVLEDFLFSDPSLFDNGHRVGGVVANVLVKLWRDLVVFTHATVGVIQAILDSCTGDQSFFGVPTH